MQVAGLVIGLWLGLLLIVGLLASAVLCPLKVSPALLFPPVDLMKRVLEFETAAQVAQHQF